jgi:hypothetical protein
MKNAVLKLKFSRAPQNDIFTLIHGTKLDLWRCSFTGGTAMKTIAGCGHRQVRRSATHARSLPP